jgi:hypothetical protein
LRTQPADRPGFGSLSGGRAKVLTLTALRPTLSTKNIMNDFSTPVWLDPDEPLPPVQQADLPKIEGGWLIQHRPSLAIFEMASTRRVKDRSLSICEASLPASSMPVATNRCRREAVTTLARSAFLAFLQAKAWWWRTWRRRRSPRGRASEYDRIPSAHRDDGEVRRAAVSKIGMSPPVVDS